MCSQVIEPQTMPNFYLPNIGEPSQSQTAHNFNSCDLTIDDSPMTRQKLTSIEDSEVTSEYEVSDDYVEAVNLRNKDKSLIGDEDQQLERDVSSDNNWSNYQLSNDDSIHGSESEEEDVMTRVARNLRGDEYQVRTGGQIEFEVG